MKVIFKYFGLFVLAYALLYFIGTRSFVANAGSGIYESISGSFMKMMLGKAELYTEPVKTEKDGVFRLVMANKAEVQRQVALAKKSGTNGQLNLEGKEFFVDFQLFFLSFWLFLVALIAITPIDLKSKLWSLLLGSIVFLLYTLVKQYILVLDFLSNQVDIGIYQYGDTASGFLSWLAGTQKAGFSALVVFLIWMAFAMRKFDWKKNLGKYTKQLKLTS